MKEKTLFSVGYVIDYVEAESSPKAVVMSTSVQYDEELQEVSKGVEKCKGKFGEGSGYKNACRSQFTQTEVSDSSLNPTMKHSAVKLFDSRTVTNMTMLNNDIPVATTAEDNQLNFELESIFKSCKTRIESKALIAAKIRNSEWLKKGQSLEDAISEYFKGMSNCMIMTIIMTTMLISNTTIVLRLDDIEILEKAEALRLHFEHEKNQFVSATRFKNAMSNTHEEDKFDYFGGGDRQYENIFSDNHSSASSCKKRLIQHDAYSGDVFSLDGYRNPHQPHFDKADFFTPKPTTFLNKTSSEKISACEVKTKPFKSPRK